MRVANSRTPQRPSREQLVHGAAGTLSLALGILFYASMRPPQAWIAWMPRLPEAAMHPILAGSAPCFLHVAAFACLTAAVTRRPGLAITGWTAVALAWEAMQGLWPTLGTSDPWDFLACVGGAGLAWIVARLAPLKQAPWAVSRWLKLPIFAAGSWALMATSTAREIRTASSEPIYMSYDDLRAAFRVEPARPLKRAGKILVSGTYLFISEPNQGIHVFDNADPSSPKPLAYLNLPGNVDLAAKGEVLYADSFVDLVAIQFSDGQFTLTQRVEWAFAYDPYQYLGDTNQDQDSEGSVYFGNKVNPQQGVVIGAK